MIHESILQEAEVMDKERVIILLMMVEVFKTNVNDSAQADMLINQIHKSFIDYKANFDLEDCDKILRIKSVNGLIHSVQVINFLLDFGVQAEILHDQVSDEVSG
jgi:hypothetical protein